MAAVPPDALRRLEGEGWRLKAEALAALVEGLAAEEQPVRFEALRAALLDADLRKLGAAGGLPDDVNRAHSSSIKGPLVLQLMAVTDVSKPSYAAPGSSRLLVLKLHDGRTACKALEHRHCPQLSDSLAPGSKVLLQQASVRLGVVLLEPRGISVLGGRVDALADAWEAQRKWGGTAPRPGMDGAAAAPAPAAPGEAAAARLAGGSSAAAVADDGASAPRFRAFVLGRDGKAQPPARQQQQQQQQAAPSAAKPQRPAAGGPSAPTREAQATAKRSVDIAPAQLLDAATKAQQGAAQARLLDKLERSQAEAEAARGRGRGRGRRGRRRGRFGGDSDDDDDGGGSGHMTFEEFEARRAALGRPGAAAAAPAAAVAAAAAADAEQLRRDEELARQLQLELDLEASGYHQPPPQQPHGRSGHFGGAGRFGRGPPRGGGRFDGSRGGRFAGPGGSGGGRGGAPAGQDCSAAFAPPGARGGGRDAGRGAPGGRGEHGRRGRGGRGRGR